MKLLLPLALLALLVASPSYAAIGPGSSNLREAITVNPIAKARCVTRRTCGPSGCFSRRVCGVGGCASRRVCARGRCSMRRVCR